MLCADLSPPRQYTGMFAQLASYTAAGYSGSSGVAELEVSATGMMSRIQFRGPVASTGALLTFSAHLHAAPCSQDGGAHYQDPSNPGVVDAVGENWPTVQCDSNGMCGGVAWNDWAPLESALVSGLSIVIHDTPRASSGSGAKWMCADLAMVNEYSGTLSRLSSYTGSSSYSSSTGTAVVAVGAMSVDSSVVLTPSSSLANVYLATHLHTLPCSASGGAHYQNNLTGAVDALNENWPAVSCDASGVCGGSASNAWAPRGSAIGGGLSVVVHDTPTSGNPKMLCADLSPAKTYSGRFTQLSSYGVSGYGSVSGTAELVVMSRGMYTQVWVQGSGLAGRTFAAHLHTSSCSVNSGGSHYQSPGNPGVVDSVSENWPTLVCDGTGNCTGGASSAWVASAGALASGLSIVIHDTPNATTGSGAKMLCADLVPPRLYFGSFNYLPSFNDTTYAGATGMAYLDVTETAGMISRLSFIAPANVAAGRTFMAHLHAAPCIADGGAHYQDPANPGVVDAVGENWPTLSCDSAGNCGGMASNDWVPTASALSSGMSFVIHDTPRATSGSGRKMYCADLSVTAAPTAAPTPAPDLEESSGGGGGGSSAGIIAAVVVVLLLVIIVICVVVYRRRAAAARGGARSVRKHTATPRTSVAVVVDNPVYSRPQSSASTDQQRYIEPTPVVRGGVNTQPSYASASYVAPSTHAVNTPVQSSLSPPPPPAPALGAATMGKCRAQFDYDATEPTELSFAEGDIITVITKADTGWWKGSVNGSTGWFPASFVEEVAEAAATSTISNAPQVALAPPPAASAPTESEETMYLNSRENVAGASLGFPTHRALYDFSGGSADELSFSENDLIQVIAKGVEGWWSGIANGVEGWFPESYVTPLDSQDTTLGGECSSSAQSEPDYAAETTAEHYANFAALERSSATDSVLQDNISKMKRASCVQPLPSFCLECEFRLGLYFE